MNKIPSYTRLSYSGLVYFKGRLYAATNVGILEVDGARPSKLYKWKDGDDVVSGPWLDVADDALWAMHDGLHKLIRFDGSTWRLIDLPTPKSGYTRGDVLRGFKGLGMKSGFWFAGGGHAWRWNNETSSWNTEESLDRDISPLERNLIAIAITERSGSYQVEHSVYANDQGYVCTENGEIFQLTSEGIKQIDSPGKCEVIAGSPSGALVASFKGLGLFEFSGEWRKKFESPYGPKTNEQWADLAVTETGYAFSVTSKPQGFGEGKTYSGPTRLWVCVDGQLVPVSFEKQ
ncbi:MAG: hypothetical protein IPL32_10335 [Chloracidobacterium sp.]|nr:hypothetical protein [Chloracidobacterium sp.]